MKILQVLRNNTLFQTRESALNHIFANAESHNDGEIWIATYGQTPDIKSILAIKHNDSVTVFDNEEVSGTITEKIEEAIENLSTIAKTGLASDAITTPIEGTSTTVPVQGDNVSDQIASLATTLKTVQDNAAKYKMLALTQDEITALSDENVKEAYKVVSFEGEETQETVYTQVGDIVKIYKDSALKEVYLGANTDTINATTGVITKNTVTDPQSMNFAYQLADGTYSLIKIDVSKFITDNEFGDGLQINNGVVSVKTDTTSSDAEDFISVGANGIKISGIQEAINNSISAYDETVQEDLATKADKDDVYDKDALNQIIEENERVVSEALNDLELRKANKEDVYTKEEVDDAISESTPVLTGYATETWVQNQGYATETWVQNQGYLTQHQDISGKADASDVEEIEHTVSQALNDLELRKANKSELPVIPTNVSDFTNDAGYLTEHQDISGKADVSDVEEIEQAVSEALNDLELRKVNIHDINNYIIEIDCGEY